MKRFTVTALRRQIYRVVDGVLHTGVPVEIQRQGRRLFIVPEGPAFSRLSRLKKRSKGIVGNPDDLIAIKVAQWKEPANLK